MVGFTRGGGEICDLKIAGKLEEKGVEVTFIYAKPLTSSVPTPVTEFETVEISTPHLQELAYRAPRGIGGVLSDIDSKVFNRRVATHIADGPYDIVRINSDPLFSSHIESLEIPVTTKMNAAPHSFWHDTINPYSSSYDLLAAFDRVFAYPDTAERLADYDQIDTTVIEPGVDTDVFTPDEQLTKDRTRLVFVGRFVPAKNLKLLLEAVSGLADRDDWELVLVGDGPLRETLEATVERLGLRDRVEFPGYVDNDDIAPYYREANVFVLSSTIEDYPLTLLEAQSAGTPVVASTVGGIPEIVDEGITGLLFESGDVDGLREALRRLLDEPERRQEMARHARERIETGFSWRQRAKRRKEIYESLTANN